MPMPLFGRRQSGAKGLEDGEKQKSIDAGPGFTVLSQEEVAARKAKAAAEKERAGRRSIGSLFPNKNKNRVSTFEEDTPGGNRGSSASSAANSSLSHPYSTGSSAHMSSSSTLPSSVGQESADDMHFGRNSHGFQPPPRPLAARDRASTIGMSGMGFPDHPGRYYSHARDNSTKDLPPPPPPHIPQPSYSYDSGFNRHRAMTASSYASTAQPPKLDLGLSNFNDFSTEMFGSREDDDSPPPTERQARAGASKPPPPPPHTFSPPPLSPYSPHDADAPLLSTSAASPRDRSSAESSFTPQKMSTSSRSQYQPISNSSTPRNSANPPVPDTKPRPRGNSIAIPAPFTEDELDNEPLFPTTSQATSKAPAHVELEPEPEDDSPKRMVTATEYERLKKLATLDPQDSEPDEYASDPDEELSDSEQKRRDRWAREKQQADLAVNRQVYKKTVGGSSDQVNRFSAQSSAFMAEVNETDADKQQFERDGDWDVPLGALVAHGFPKGGATARPSLSGNRPPTSASQFEMHTSGQFATPPSRPASATGNFVGASNVQLPAFARNLPADPYANLAGGVVPSHPREQLRFNGRSSSVPYAQPPMPQMPQAQPQTNSTLVGIIQGEEVAKAARRGSPSAALIASQQQQSMFQQSMQNPYQQQPRPVSQMPMGAMQMGNGAMQPEFQTLAQQIAFQQQMMVQMQQQMMQMQMQSSGASMINGQVPQPMVMPQFPQSNPMQSQLLQLPGQGPRPMSMAGHMGGMSGMGGMGNMGFQQRRPDSAYQGSMYAPSVMGMPPSVPRHGGYAPSIAPSERNTTGLSARYRSVGYVNGDQHSSAGASRTGTPGPIKATLKQAGSQGKLQARSAEESDEEKSFAEAAAKARARRAKSSEPTTRV